MFIHFSDTHLGYSDYHKVDATSGLNQREVDVYKAFKFVIDYILDTKPRFVIHAGDLFDTSRPPNRTISFVMAQLERLSRNNIKTIIISGNHSTPRIALTGSIFESFKVFPNIFPVYQGKYEQIEIEDYLIHCIPHCSTEEIMMANIKEIKCKDGYKNILVTHAGISGSDSHETGEFNEQKIPQTILERKDFDYIALGHYHRQAKIGKAYYCGATERFSTRHADLKTGFLEVNDKTFESTFIETPSRPMYSCEIGASGKSWTELEDEVKKVAKESEEGAIVLLNFKGIKKSDWLAVERDKIDNLFRKCFVLEMRPVFEEEEGYRGNKSSIDDLPIEFQNFVNSLEGENIDKEAIRKMGMDYLNQASDLQP